MNLIIECIRTLQKIDFDTIRAQTVISNTILSFIL